MPFAPPKPDEVDENSGFTPPKPEEADFVGPPAPTADDLVSPVSSNRLSIPTSSQYFRDEKFTTDTNAPKTSWEAANTDILGGLGVSKSGERLFNDITSLGLNAFARNYGGPLGRGLSSGTEEIQNALRSPISVAGVEGAGLLSKAPVAAQRLINAAFAVMGAKHVGEQGIILNDAVKKGDWETAAKAATGIVASSGQTALGAYGAGRGLFTKPGATPINTTVLSPERVPIERQLPFTPPPPDAIDVDATVTSTTGEPNAVRQLSAGSLLQHTQEGAGETGGQRGGVEQGQQGQAPAQAQPPAQPQGGTPVSQEIAKIQALTPAEQTTYFRANQSRADNAAYRLGLAVTDPSDLQALEQAHAAASAKAQQAKAAGDLNTAMVMQVVAQNFREAHEAATGTGSAGHFLSENVEGYEPPIPLTEKQSINSKLEAAKAKAAPVQTAPIQTPTATTSDEFGTEPSVVKPSPLPTHLAPLQDYFEPGSVFGPEKLAEEGLTREHVVSELTRLAGPRDMQAIFDALKNKRKASAALKSLMMVPYTDEGAAAIEAQRLEQRKSVGETPEQTKARHALEANPTPPTPEQLEMTAWQKAWDFRQGLIRKKGINNLTAKDAKDLKSADAVIARMNGKYGTPDPAKYRAKISGAPKFQPPTRSTKRTFNPGDKVAMVENGVVHHGEVYQAGGDLWVKSSSPEGDRTMRLSEGNWIPESELPKQNRALVKYEPKDLMTDVLKQAKLSNGSLKNSLSAALESGLMERVRNAMQLLKTHNPEGAQGMFGLIQDVLEKVTKAAKESAKLKLEYPSASPEKVSTALAELGKSLDKAEESVRQQEQQQQTGPSAPKPNTGPGAKFGITPQPPKFITQFITDDVLPALGRVKDAGVAAGHLFVSLFAPASLGKPSDVDILFKSKGGKEKFMTQAAAALEGSRKMMAKLDHNEQIAFVDRIKRGLPHPTPELQNVADIMRVWDDKLHAEASVFKPNLEYLDNHYRVLWKVIPGTAGKTGTALEQIMSKRPWRGSRGFFLKHTLADMSDGIAKGGVPVTYNPIDMFMLHAQDVTKFIAANRAWNAMKDAGTAVFVKIGQEPPPGYSRLDDSIARPYFRTEEGLLAKSGEWWVQDGAAHLLNNYLSRDFVRQGAFGAIGRGLVDLKNASTAVELALSPFHAVFETNEAVGSAIGRAIVMVTEGQFLKAGKEFGKALPGTIPLLGAIIPKTASTEVLGLGSKIVAFGKNPADFKARYPDAYKALTKLYPDFEKMVDDLFSGGGQVGMHDNYHIQAAKGFSEALANDNYIGAVIRAAPAISQQMLRPIFDIYIPRLKLGTWLKDYAFELERRSDDLASGKVTREQLARETWAFVEDRFGELNWDNLYWNRTFKSAMQLVFRSVTWKLGNIRGFGKGIRDLGLLTRDISKFAAGDKTVRPRVTLPMGWLIAMAFVTAIQSTIITKVLTGKYPWQLAHSADDLTKNLTFPRTDADDPSQRVSIPTYWKDAVHLAHSPPDYLRSSMTGEIGRAIDGWDNKDFYGTQVRNPDDPVFKQAKDVLEHMIPLPFSASSFLSARQSGASIAKSASGFLGYTKAPYYVSHTQAERLADELIRNQLPIGSRTREQYNKTIQEKQVVQAVKHGQMTLDQAVDQGMITEQRYRALQNQADSTTLQHQVEKLGVNDAMKVWHKASPDEQEQIRDIIEKKIFNSKTMEADDRERATQQLENETPK